MILTIGTPVRGGLSIAGPLGWSAGSWRRHAWALGGARTRFDPPWNSTTAPKNLCDAREVSERAMNGGMERGWKGSRSGVGSGAHAGHHPPSSCRAWQSDCPRDGQRSLGGGRGPIPTAGRAQSPPEGRTLAHAAAVEAAWPAMRAKTPPLQALLHGLKGPPWEFISVMLGLFLYSRDGRAVIRSGLHSEFSDSVLTTLSPDPKSEKVQHLFGGFKH